MTWRGRVAELGSGELLQVIRNLYNRLTRIAVDGRSTQCDCCGLRASWGERATKVRHLPDCELATLYEAMGGEVEWRKPGRL